MCDSLEDWQLTSIIRSTNQKSTIFGDVNNMLRGLYNYVYVAYNLYSILLYIYNKYHDLSISESSLLIAYIVIYVHTPLILLIYI